MKSPTPDQIRQAREAAFPGLPVPEARRKFGRLVWSTERAVRAWEEGYRTMHPGLWELAERKIGDLVIREIFASAATPRESRPDTGEV